MVPYTKFVESNKRKHEESKSPKTPDQTDVPIHILNVSPDTAPGAEPSVWYVQLLETQVRCAAAKVFLKIMKELKNQDGTGWAMTYGNKKWYSIDNEGRVRCAPHSHIPYTVLVL